MKEEIKREGNEREGIVGGVGGKERIKGKVIREGNDREGIAEEVGEEGKGEREM